MKTVPIDILRKHLRLDSNTGSIYWMIPTSKRVKPGDLALTMETSGYGCFTINGVRLRTHNVVWALTYGEWPTTRLDHRSRVRLENHIDNLRLSTLSLDSRNTVRVHRPKSGYRGVYFNRQAGLYNARTTHEKKEISLGYFKDPSDAAKAYDEFVVTTIGEGYPTNANLGWL